jgi:hypothetical protein
MQRNRIWNALGDDDTVPTPASVAAERVSSVFMVIPLAFAPPPWVVQLYQDAYEQARRAATPARTVTFSLN